ncbi:MAG TPA: hypothetical protein VJI75_06360 [Candidatus Nanoarchaeia archaeon]|nr:hypothetical protein [Candidatus Nanoarchaeia archaeon]
MSGKELLPIEREIIELELEKSRIDREKSMLVLNKGLFLYFCFLFVAVIGFVNGFISKDLLNILIIMSLCVIVIATLPYIRIMHREERKLVNLIEHLKAKKRGMV